MGLVGLAVLGLTLSLSFLLHEWHMDFNRGHDNRLRNIGRFFLGAESIALFARVGGGIYTKAADVGADLVKSRLGFQRMTRVIQLQLLIMWIT
jgi:Na+/H+-translocating membrane pyrophosphatase